MDNMLSLRLEAHNDAENRHRVYEIMVGRNLFAHRSLRILYGRAGQRLRERRFSDENEHEIARLIRRHLQRRHSAPRRFGCPYSIRFIDVADDWGAGDSVAEELLSAFASVGDHGGFVFSRSATGCRTGSTGSSPS